MSISERKKEIKRRRHRLKKMGIFTRKLRKATVSEKAIIADKIRALRAGGRSYHPEPGPGKEARRSLHEAAEILRCAQDDGNLLRITAICSG